MNTVENLTKVMNRWKEEINAQKTQERALTFSNQDMQTL